MKNQDVLMQSSPPLFSLGRACSRRRFLKTTGAAMSVASLGSGVSWAAQRPMKRPKVAVIMNVFFYRSHAHVLLENFLYPYLFNGVATDPGVDLVSFYVDQFPKKEMARDTARKHKIPIYKTIDEALCLGGKQLAVDAVLLIGEHGSYPRNAMGVTMYPRKQFFDAIVKVMRRSNRFVPLFNDKHLSYRWDWAKEMADMAHDLGIPLMAGSSVPLAQRRPDLELPADAQFDDVISIHGGGIESYDFHGLEVLQSMVEARRGGESGIGSVEFLEGDAIWNAGEQGRWSIELAPAAMANELGQAPFSLKPGSGNKIGVKHGILVHYKDGLRGTVLAVGNSGIRWNFACRLQGESKTRATRFYTGPWQNRNLFKALAHAIQHHFIHGKAPYPVERTLLVSGALASAMQSRQQAGKPIDTPHLEFGYAARDYRAMREMGKSWEIINEQTIQPRGVHPGPLSK